MATIALVETEVPPRLNLKESVLVAWANLANGDQGAPMELTEFSDKTVQVGVTGDNFGSGTVSIEGSNDGTTWAVLRSPLGTALSGLNTVGVIHAILENPRFIRPSLAGGAAGAVTVRIMGHRSRGRAL